MAALNNTWMQTYVIVKSFLSNIHIWRIGGRKLPLQEEARYEDKYDQGADHNKIVELRIQAKYTNGQRVGQTMKPIITDLVISVGIIYLCSYSKVIDKMNKDITRDFYCIYVTWSQLRTPPQIAHPRQKSLAAQTRKE